MKRVCFFKIENWIQVPNVCRYFLNGNCRFGEFCRNSHNIQREEPTAVESIMDSDQQDTNNNTHNETNEIKRNWIDAPEFIPRNISQNTVDTNSQENDDDQGATRYAKIIKSSTL